MIERMRDLAARSLLPVFLISLALLLVPLADDAGDASCMRWAAERDARGLDAIDPGTKESVDTLLSRVQAASRAAHRHYAWLFYFTCAFSGAYLLFSREKFSLRLAVVAVVLVTVVAPTVFGSIC